MPPEAEGKPAASKASRQVPPQSRMSRESLQPWMEHPNGHSSTLVPQECTAQDLGVPSLGFETGFPTKPGAF